MLIFFSLTIKKTNNELIKPSQTVSSKEVNSSEELIQKAKELLEKNKQTIANQINEVGTFFF